MISPCLPEIGIESKKWDIHAIYIPEINFDLKIEVKRLKNILDNFDTINIFLSEGAGIDNIIAEKEKIGEEIKRDAFGHVRLDEINPGQWYAKFFGEKLKCDKVLVQKSGYFSRSSAPNKEDLELIFNHADYAVKVAMQGKNGVVGIKENNKEVSCIPFQEIKGGKPFDITSEWFEKLLISIGQIKN